MEKYKVGDRVIVNNDPKPSYLINGLNVQGMTQYMKKFCGKVVTIEQVLKPAPDSDILRSVVGVYTIKEDGDHYWFGTDFEGLAGDPVYAKEFSQRVLNEVL